MNTIGFSEIDPYATAILKRHWPDVPNYGDIRNVRGVRADVVTGGFPCQPFSVAGQQRGAEDDRHLWPEMLRVIDDAGPAWVVGENVPGIIGMALDDVLSELEARGYAAWPLVIPACGVDARHRRERVWIVAHAERLRRREPAAHPDEAQGPLHPADREESAPRAGSSGEALADAARERERKQADKANALTTCWDTWQESGGGSWWRTEPELGRVADGIPNRVDRLRGLGNAIVPQVAFPLLDAIAAIELGGAVADARGGSAWERVSGKAEFNPRQAQNGEPSDSATETL
jgi:DNA (cytosine-5)-methyltransferase 1